MTKTSRISYNTNTIAQSALMLTESEYIAASVQSKIRGTAQEMADIITKLTIKFSYRPTGTLKANWNRPSACFIHAGSRAGTLG